MRNQEGSKDGRDEGAYYKGRHVKF